MTTIHAKSFEETRATHPDTKMDNNLAEHKSEQNLLNRALYASASIHQPHGLKAFLAAQSLALRFDNDALSGAEEMHLSQQVGQGNSIWQQTSDLIGQSEIQVEGLITPKVVASEFSEFRIKKVLDLWIYPAAYQAIYQWYQNKGFADIFAYYLEIATKYNEYLSHNVTILLAFNRLYPQLDATQVIPFLERFTEFATSSFAGKGKGQDKEVDSQDSLTKDKRHQDVAYDFKSLLQVCLKQPSFFAHNMITLAWIMRSKAELNEQQLSRLTNNLYQQATRPLDDPDDGIDEALFTASVYQDQAGFDLSLKQMVFNQCHNLHQVTLADALAYLHESILIERFSHLPLDQEAAAIRRLADYYVRVFESLNDG